MNKRGQASVFVIIAILVVVSVVILFIFLGGGKIPGIIPGEKNPDAILSSCLEPKAREVMNKIANEGGYYNGSLFRIHEGEKVNYLCYNQNNYYPCINQEPMLLNHLKDEIKRNTARDVEECINEVRAELEKEGYEVRVSSGNFDVELMPKKVVFNIRRSFTYTKNEQTFRRSSFNVAISSKFYELTVVAQEISSQEARFCNFEQQGYMLFYPQYDIDRFKTWDLSTIYTIADRKTKEFFRFAVRGCVIPPGIG